MVVQYQVAFKVHITSFQISTITASEILAGSKYRNSISCSDSSPHEMPETVAQIMDSRRAASLLGRVGPKRGYCCQCDLSLKNNESTVRS